MDCRLPSGVRYWLPLGAPLQGWGVELGQRRRRKTPGGEQGCLGGLGRLGGRGTSAHFKAQPSPSGGSCCRWQAELREAKARVLSPFPPPTPPGPPPGSLLATKEPGHHPHHESRVLGETQALVPPHPELTGCARRSTGARDRAGATPRRSHLRPPSRKSLRGRAPREPWAGRHPERVRARPPSRGARGDGTRARSGASERAGPPLSGQSWLGDASAARLAPAARVRAPSPRLPPPEV